MPTSTHKGTLYKLEMVPGEKNIYRHHGEFHAATGWPSGVEVFVKEPGTRRVVGRWLPCPSWNVAKRIMHMATHFREEGTDNEPQHRVGEYIADYSEVNLADFPTPEMDAVIARSRVISERPA